jgi:hypothetical protein
MDSMSWSQGRGSISSSIGIMLLLEKPELSFEFDSLYYGDELMKKVVSDTDFALTQAEQDEIADWIEQQLELPLLVNGVDADGNYLEGVPASAIVKTVSIPPPSMTGWRYDFTAGEGDHWVQLH